MLRNSKGITLVELLIVIVILGIIAAIAVPAVGNIVENAEKDALTADAQQIESSAQTAAASENWNVFDFDWEDASIEEDAGVLSNMVDDVGDLEDIPEVEELEEQGYIDGVDSYIAWIYDGRWVVAIQDDDWLAIGHPDELDRDDVTDMDDEDDYVDISEDLNINDLEDLEEDELEDLLTDEKWNND